MLKHNIQLRREKKLSEMFKTNINGSEAMKVLIEINDQRYGQPTTFSTFAITLCFRDQMIAILC